MNPDTSFELRALQRLFHERKSTALVRWQWGQVDPLMVEATISAQAGADLNAAQTVAVAFAWWHRGLASLRHGASTTTLGKAMRQCGKPGTYGPKDAGAVRAMDQLCNATTYPALHEAVLKAVKRLDPSNNSAPNWEKLHTDLVAWQHSPATRDITRMSWLRDFHTFDKKEN